VNSLSLSLVQKTPVRSISASDELTRLAWIIHDFAGEKRKGALKD
jgi:hypothetical protein